MIRSLVDLITTSMNRWTDNNMKVMELRLKERLKCINHGHC